MAGEKFYLLEDKTKRKRKANDRDKVILNTIAMLSRNLINKKFPGASSGRERNTIIEEVKEAAGDIKEFEDFQYYRIGNLDKIQRDLLFKDYMVDEGAAKRMQGRGLFVRTAKDPGISTAVIINYEDHVRIQSSCPGLNIRRTYNEIMGIEKYFEKKLSFVFDSNIGYLTASPLNLGTALRITIIAHLPVLAVSPEIVDFVKKINNIGCQINGYFVGQSEIIGNLFEISNRITLGKGEKDIVKEMEAICLSVVEDEKNARIQLKKNDSLGIEDNIYRSFGLLKYAKILSYEEALELLSIIKLGLDLDIIDGVYDFDFFELINKITDPHIIRDMELSDGINSDRLDSVRAEIIRKKILKEAD